MKAEMLGLSGCDCPQARAPSKWSEMHWSPAISYYSSTKQYCRLRVGVQDKAVMKQP
jgi:hypothetical protein